MSFLAIALIVVALIGLTSLSTVYFGGDYISDGAQNAAVARYLNESSQIAGAVRYYQAENGGELPTDLAVDLVPDYLVDMPKSGEDWNIGTDVLVKTVDTASTCERINQRAGIADPTPKQCSDISLESESYYCCVDNS